MIKRNEQNISSQSRQSDRTVTVLGVRASFYCTYHIIQKQGEKPSLLKRKHVSIPCCEYQVLESNASLSHKRRLLFFLFSQAHFTDSLRCTNIKHSPNATRKKTLYIDLIYHVGFKRKYYLIG